MVADEAAPVPAGDEATQCRTCNGWVNYAEGEDHAPCTCAMRAAGVASGDDPGPTPAVDAVLWQQQEDQHYDLWDCSVAGASLRFMRFWSDCLLLVRRPGERAQPYANNAAHGIWRADPDLLATMLQQSAEAWLMAALDARLPKEQFRQVATQALRLRDPQYQARVYQACGGTYGEWEVKGRKAPARLRVVDLADLDAPGRYLGVQNGVVDLSTGALLQEDEARACLVTRQAGAKYIPPDVGPPYQDPAVEQLLGRFPEDEREWLLGAFGYALRGYPSRRIYLLQGGPAGGKSTLARAIIGALGDYAQGLDAATLSDKAAREARSTAVELAPFTERRVVVYSEPRGKLSPQRLKDASGGDTITYRRLYSNAVVSRPSVCTIFMLANEGHVPYLPLEDEALADRLKVLEVPSIPPAERRAYLSKVVEGEAVREALLALLIAAAVRHQEPPADVPSVVMQGKVLRRAMIGDAGEWLETAIVHDPSGRLGTTQLWDAALQASGGTDRAWNVDRKRILELARALHPLGALRRGKVGGVRQHIWDGWRLASEDEQATTAALEEAQLILRDPSGDHTVAAPPGQPTTVLEVQPGATARDLMEQLRASGWRALSPGLEKQTERLMRALELGGSAEGAYEFMGRETYECPQCGRAMLSEGLCWQCQPTEEGGK